jgi:rare lipoprotein A
MPTDHTTKARFARFCLMALLTALTASCTTYRAASHPPAGQQPVSTSSRQPATQRPYTVDGKRYEPLSSHQGFEQEGIASSYGRDFHGRRTSSGETFDMNAMTAAHKTLPMGVNVRVQHKRSGREVVVRINDRGPFVKDRIIDLSEYAAANLGMLQEGVAPVKITALGYKSESPGGPGGGYRQPANYDDGAFALQVGAFTVRANAVRYAEELRRKYGTADLQETVVNGTTYHRVRLGRYTSLRAAQAGQEQYERKGFTGCFVVAVD